MTDDTPWHAGLGLSQDDAKYLNDKGLGSAADLVASYRQMERYQGNSIALPGADADPGEWDRLHARLGRPETPAGYDFSNLGDLDQAGQDTLAWYRGVAHELGLSQRQAAAFLERYAERGQAQAAQAEAARAAEQAAAMAALQAEWGGEAERNTALAARAMDTLGLNEAEVAALSAGPGGQAALARIMARIAPRLGEDEQIGQGRAGQLTLSPAEAQARIQAVYGDAEHPYHQGGHPGHDAAVAAMQTYFQAANPEEPAA